MSFTTVRRAKQVDFGSVLYSSMERLLALERIHYHKPINIIRQFFDFYMQLRVQGPVRIFPIYPSSWYAEVLSEDKVWTVECLNGEFRLVKVGDLVGYTPNGNYITTAEEDLSDNPYYQQQSCEYKGLKEPILCRDFCDNGDYDEYRCHCCPWMKNN
jgi:hypothetical protein